MTYPDLITDLLYNTYLDQFQSAQPGHCMKLSGVSDGVLHALCARLRAGVPTLDTFLLDASRTEAPYTTATKLIELRNREERPLLVLCPTTLRTAAEDSFGEATFQVLPTNDVEMQLFQQLRGRLDLSLQTPFRLVHEQLGGGQPPTIPT